MKRYQIVSVLSIIAIVLSFAVAPAGSALATNGAEHSIQARSGAGWSVGGVLSALKRYAPSFDLGENYDMRIRKVADADQVRVGDPIGFTIRVGNIATRTLANVTVNDQLDPSIGWTENSPWCEISESGLLTCAFGEMVPGQNETVHISAISTGDICGTLTNTATATADQRQPVQATATIDIQCAANVTLDKSPVTATITGGQIASFRLVVTSNGHVTAEGVTLVDNLPSLAGLSWSVDAPNAADCPISANVMTCSFGDMPTGTSRTVIVSSPTPTDYNGDIENTAVVSATNEDGDGGDDTDTGIITIVNGASLVLEKVADRDVVNGNDPIGWQLTVTNTSNSTATNVVLSDPLPAGVEWTEDSTYCAIDGSNLLTCNFGSLAAHASVSVHISGVSNASVCGAVSNTATVTAGNLTVPVTDSATVQVNCAPSLSVRKIAENNIVVPGAPIRFTITVANNGTALAQNVQITDTLPADASLSWSYENLSTGSCSIDDGLMICSFGDLAPEASASVQLVAAAGTQTCGTIVNTVTANAQNSRVVSDIVEVDVLCNPNVSVTKTPVMETIHAGVESEPAQFVIEVVSNGLGAAQNVMITDDLPTDRGLVWSVGSVTGGGSCAISSGVLTCDFGTLPSGATRSVVISSPTSPLRFCLPGADPFIGNMVTVSSSNEPVENLFDNSAYSKIIVACPAEEMCTFPDGYYQTNFNSGADPTHWSDTKITTAPNGTQTFLGDFGNQNLLFNYTDTDPNGHVQVMVSFDLYLLRSWDGNNTVRPNGEIVGPDIISVNLLNSADQVVKPLLYASFSNYNDEFGTLRFSQSYPLPYGQGARIIPRTGALRFNSLGYNFGGPRDTTYRLIFAFQHSDPNIRISIGDEGLQPLLDESWGIDNFNMRIMRCATAFSFSNGYYLPFISGGSTIPRQTIVNSDIRTDDR